MRSFPFLMCVPLQVPIIKWNAYFTVVVYITLSMCDCLQRLPNLVCTRWRNTLRVCVHGAMRPSKTRASRQRLPAKNTIFYYPVKKVYVPFASCSAKREAKSRARAKRRVKHHVFRSVWCALSCPLKTKQCPGT